MLRWSAMNCFKMECGTGLGTRWQSWATMPPTPPTLCYWYCTLLVPRTSPNAPQPMHQHQSALSTAHHKTPEQTWWPAGVLPPSEQCNAAMHPMQLWCPGTTSIHLSTPLPYRSMVGQSWSVRGVERQGGMHHAPPHSLQSRVPGHLWPPCKPCGHPRTHQRECGNPTAAQSAASPAPQLLLLPWPTP